ncbi:SusE domain-containing protein [Winogradskyella flava]|uniref:SusE domain-containing protein n=1 Tax=Winogradskyella flava TaxID=1884876 RepID=UPI002490A894|nr:SusE domain-containing protein [Winogradskyella flava]
MKKLSILGLFIFALISFNSCETEDDVVFTTQDPEGFVFTNSVQDNYILSTSTTGNLGERFTWGNADFGTPTNVTYQLQSSISGDFTDANVVEESINNEIAMTIGQMMTIAIEAGLDDDPDSAAPNTGSFSVRLRAFPGDNGSGTEAFSNALVLNVELLEQMDTGGSEIMPASWGVVGSGYNDWGGAGPDGTFYTSSEADVIVTYVTLVDGEIKFRENDTWGGDLGDANGDGVLDADPDNNIAVTAGNYKITINTSTNAYTIEPFSWGIVGSAWNDWGGAGPDAKTYYDYTTDTFKVGVRLMDGEMKLRFNNTWGGDYGDANGDGILDQDADNNIAVTAGHYLLTVNLNDLSYTLEASDVWGVVGSGFNDWGGAGDDFALTQVNPNVYVGDLATLIDGEIKFRNNNTWGGDFGDAGGDGILDQDPDNNIAVTAGNYRIRIDFNDNSYQLNRIN